LVLAASPLTAQNAAQDSANPVAPSAQGDVSVTIYNNNLALVQDVRTLDIASRHQPDRVSRCLGTDPP
jgi:hypothetical protein